MRKNCHPGNMICSRNCTNEDMMHNTHGKKSNVIRAYVDQTTVGTGPIRWPSRGGVHKDKRRVSRNNSRISFKKEM